MPRWQVNYVAGFQPGLNCPLDYLFRPGANVEIRPTRRLAVSPVNGEHFAARI